MQIRKAWKFLQLLPGNGETTARPDLDLCDLCSQLSYVHIFHIFNKRHMLWVKASAPAQPLFTPSEERSRKGPGLPCKYLSPGRGDSPLASGHQQGSAASSLPPDVGRRDTQPLILASKKHDEVFLGLIFQYINRSTDAWLCYLSAQHLSDHA